MPSNPRKEEKPRTPSTAKTASQRLPAASRMKRSARASLTSDPLARRQFRGLTSKGKNLCSRAASYRRLSKLANPSHHVHDNKVGCNIFPSRRSPRSGQFSASEKIRLPQVTLLIYNPEKDPDLSARVINHVCSGIEFGAVMHLSGRKPSVPHPGEWQQVPPANVKQGLSAQRIRSIEVFHFLGQGWLEGGALMGEVFQDLCL